MIISIQYLRALAASLVLARHTFQGFGEQGVDIFFVISGYIMLHIINHKPRTSLHFFAARFFRIAPLYYFLTLLGIAVGFIKLYSIDPLLRSFSFWIFDLERPLLFLGWTLEFEFIFYSLCALALFCCKQIKHIVSFIVGGLVVMFVVQDLILFSDKFRGYFFEFLYGVIIYQLIHRNKIKPSNTLTHYPLIAIAVTTLVLSHYFITQSHHWYARFLTTGLPSALLCYAVICLEPKLTKIPFLLTLGNASYALYLSHPITKYLLVTYCFSKGPLTLFAYSACLVGSIIVAIIIHQLIEQPIQKCKLADRIYYSQATQKALKRLPKSISKRL